MSTDDRRMLALITEQAAEWFVRHRAGELEAAERGAFIRWLQASPLHVQEYLALSGLAGDLEAGVQAHDVDLDALLAMADDNPQVVPLRTEPAPPVSGLPLPPWRRAALEREARERPRRRRRARIRAAVAGVLVAVVAVALWQGPWLKTRDFVTRHGEQRTWQLPDNSLVRLNSDSAIAIRFDDVGRHVEVRRGQVYFEVAEDPLRPFSVAAGSYFIEDIGTAFDVYRHAEATTVTVVEGRVRVWEDAIPAPAMRPPADLAPEAVERLQGPKPLADLGPGGQVRIARSGQVAAIPEANVEVATAWVRERIIFDGDPIRRVADEFNRYNQQQIVVMDAAVGNIPVSGVFRSYDVQSFVDFLNGLPGVRAELQDGRILVSTAS